MFCFFINSCWACGICLFVSFSVRHHGTSPRACGPMGRCLHQSCFLFDISPGVESCPLTLISDLILRHVFCSSLGLSWGHALLCIISSWLVVNRAVVLCHSWHHGTNPHLGGPMGRLCMSRRYPCPSSGRLFCRCHHAWDFAILARACCSVNVLRWIVVIIARLLGAYGRGSLWS